MSKRNLGTTSAKPTPKLLSRQLKAKSQQFLASRNKTEPLVSILDEFEVG